ncbi:MAG: zinc-ribbon and DUF3426 domain-containing protein [Wenzhouxiangella sp.]
MHTRCPACETAFELSAEHLAAAQGKVRCGECGRIFNALAQLFAQPPSAGTTPIESTGDLPLLQRADLVQPGLPGLEPSQPEAPPLLFPDSEPDNSDHGQRTGRRALWTLASLGLGGLLAWQLFSLWQDEQSWLRALGSGSELISAASATDAIQILSRDLHRHPSLDEAVVLSVVLNNLEQQPVAWPVLEIRLFDASQQVLGARQLQPAQYLSPGQDPERGIQPGVLTPIIVEIVIGGSEPAGFELAFR